MSTEIESQTPHFGLRDFLQYFLPGGVVLAAAGIATGVRITQLAEWGNIGFSLLAILVSYLLGHAVYPLNYPLRRLIARNSHEEKGTDEFRSAYMWVVERHPTFYVAEVFRYRSLARFSVAMVLPTAALGLSAGARLWAASKPAGLAAVALGLVCSSGFALRYRRYQATSERYVTMCRNYPWSANP
jgi:hypothetical protein